MSHVKERCGLLQIDTHWQFVTEAVSSVPDFASKFPHHTRRQWTAYAAVKWH